ncbi:hypothetical protein DYU11_24080 [Fibrisoma montanum]|uniref:Lysoplasmalogenase n=1 Tax=Fibrisoma montanum TaxID=2305895 RepID=A0A418M2U5_9BACT|nr:hypothetical protein [Fibrisoma montanum]RIV19996.1 hypothetical protein DYU11_24080 [Fibrisoma montanum]
MKLVDVAMYLVYIATYGVIVPVGIGLYLVRHLNKPLKIALAGLCLSLVLDLGLLAVNFKITNTFYYLFSGFDLLIMAWLYSSVITHKTFSNVIQWSGIFFIPLIGLDAFFISGLTNNGFSNAVEKFYVMVIAIYYLTQLLLEKIDDDIRRQPLFWISAGIVIANLVGSFDIFSRPVINYSQTIYLQYFMFWSFVTILMFGAYSYAFWLSQRDR